ncbi:MAG: hypothetical protein WBV46_01805 [Terriglobales bacterium]|jgi:hypothetical protein
MHASPKKLIAPAALCLILVGCAQTGPPLPPSLELPKPPTDLRATRKGNTVTLTWSEPALTTDHQSVRYLGPTLICRSAETDITTCANQVAIVPPPGTIPQKPNKKSQQQKPTPPPLQTYADPLPASAESDNPDAELTYAVEVLNRNARGAGLSNRVHVPAITTLPAPADLSATLNEDGVDLTWTSVAAPPAKTGVEYRYRIYRRDETRNDEPAVGKPAGKKEKHKDAIAAELPIGPAGSAHFLDPIEWEKTYQYRITAVTIITRPESQIQLEGDDSAPLEIVAHDIFPPAIPAGLQAVYSGEGQRPYIDLIWAPVPSADLSGYNIYRREAGSALVRVNLELVKTPSYRDMAVAPGKTYVYSVSAVDVRGNESRKSDEASESVP